MAHCHTRPCMACFCRELVIVFGFVYIMYISLCLSGVSTSFCMVWLYPVFYFFGSLFPFCLFFSLIHVYGIAGLPVWLLLIIIHIYILIKKKELNSKWYIFYLNIKILFFIFYLLTNNSFLPYRLCDYWYERRKKQKTYVKERYLPGWKDVAVWRDFRSMYVLEAIWAEYIQHMTSKCFVWQS